MKEKKKKTIENLLGINSGSAFGHVENWQSRENLLAESQKLMMAWNHVRDDSLSEFVELAN